MSCVFARAAHLRWAFARVSVGIVWIRERELSDDIMFLIYLCVVVCFFGSDRLSLSPTRPAMLVGENDEKPSCQLALGHTVFSTVTHARRRARRCH